MPSDSSGGPPKSTDPVTGLGSVPDGCGVERSPALDDIVASKEFAKRDKDHDALPELYRLQGRDGDGPEPTARPAGHTLSNSLDRPDGPQKRPPDRSTER